MTCSNDKTQLAERLRAILRSDRQATWLRREEYEAIQQAALALSHAAATCYRLGGAPVDKPCPRCDCALAPSSTRQHNERQRAENREGAATIAGDSNPLPLTTDPVAYIFNGNLFWPDGLVREQQERAQPLYFAPSASGEGTLMLLQRARWALEGTDPDVTPLTSEEHARLVSDLKAASS